MRPDVEYAMNYLVAVARYNGITATVVSGDRDTHQQSQLYNAWLARGRTGLPAAAPGTSRHEQGRAFDLHVSPREWLPALGALWESWGGRWGGRFNDPVHFDV